MNGVLVVKAKLKTDLQVQCYACSGLAVTSPSSENQDKIIHLVYGLSQTLAWRDHNAPSRELLSMH